MLTKSKTEKLYDPSNTASMPFYRVSTFARPIKSEFNADDTNVTDVSKIAVTYDPIPWVKPSSDDRGFAIIERTHYANSAGEPIWERPINVPKSDMDVEPVAVKEENFEGLGASQSNDTDGYAAEWESPTGPITSRNPAAPKKRAQRRRIRTTEKTRGRTVHRVIVRPSRLTYE